MEDIFDIAQLDASTHLKALGRRIFLRVPLGMPDWNQKQLRLIFFYLLRGRAAFSAEKVTHDLVGVMLSDLFPHPFPETLDRIEIMSAALRERMMRP